MGGAWILTINASSARCARDVELASREIASLLFGNQKVRQACVRWRLSNLVEPGREAGGKRPFVCPTKPGDIKNECKMTLKTRFISCPMERSNKLSRLYQSAVCSPLAPLENH